MGLFKPAWQSENRDKRKAAVMQLDDPGILETIALSDDSDDIRKIAIERIVDEAVLKRIAATDGASVSDYVRAAAIQMIRDQTFLSGILEQELLKGDMNPFLMMALASSITSEAALAKLALTSRNGQVVEICTHKINDPALLMDIVFHYGLQGHERAYMKIKNTFLHTDGYTQSGDIDSGELKAKLRETGSKRFAALFACCESSLFTAEILDDLTQDQGVLYEVAVSGLHPANRLLACERLTNPQLLAAVAATRPNDYAYDVCVAATKRLTNPNALRGLLNGYIDVRKAAEARLSELSGNP